MKNLKFTFFFLLLAAFFVNAPMSYAVKTVTTPVSTEATVKTEKKGKFFKNLKKKRTSLKQRFSKWKHNLVGKILKKGIDLQDPVKKWLWYALIGLGGAIIFSILGSVLAVGAVAAGTSTGVGISLLLGIVAGLLYLAGTVAFVIWLVKKFG